LGQEATCTPLSPSVWAFQTPVRIDRTIEEWADRIRTVMRGSRDSVHEVHVDGLRIAFQREGQGPPLLFLHGFFGDHRVWRRQFELADEYTVVAWDAPGCGGSSTPPPTFGMPEYADALARFVEVLGLERPHVVGNSFGGTLALQLAFRHASIPRSVVAAGAYAGWSGSFPPDVVAQRLSQSLPDLELPAEDVVAKWTPGFVTTSAPASVLAELEAIISDFDPDGMRVMIRALAEADLREALPHIAVPTLLIWGDQDVRSPLSVADDLRTRIPGSRLVVIPGAGHLSHVEAPERFNAEVRGFLRSV
jgi:pimeloyl-ACP methyl ester carboxylesterase